MRTLLTSPLALALLWSTGAAAQLRYTVDVRDGSSHTAPLFSPTVAGSLVWQWTQTFNLMLEVVDASIQTFDGPSRTRENQFIVSPGFRTAVNFKETQVVLGLAMPVNTTPDRTDVSVFTYFSYETRFRK